MVVFYAAVASYSAVNSRETTKCDRPSRLNGRFPWLCSAQHTNDRNVNSEPNWKQPCWHLHPSMSHNLYFFVQISSSPLGRCNWVVYSFVFMEFYQGAKTMHTRHRNRDNATITSDSTGHEIFWRNLTSPLHFSAVVPWQKTSWHWQNFMNTYIMWGQVQHLGGALGDVHDSSVIDFSFAELLSNRSDSPLSERSKWNTMAGVVN